jgi:nucleolar GTP-binding protein
LFIIDPTEESGSLKSQQALLEEIKENFDVPIVVAYSKADLHDKRDLPAFSSVTGEGIDEILKILKDILFKSND